MMLGAIFTVLVAVTDWPAIITAIGVFVASVLASATALYSTIKNGRAIQAVDNAVNNRDGGTTVSQDVAAMAARFPAQDLAAKVVLDAAEGAAKTEGPDEGVTLATPEEPAG